jgi:hypothetical protein
MDITQLILDDHQEQRRLFSILEQLDRTDAKSLAAMWTRLAAFLEVHAEAEEQIFYPALLRVGQGAGGKPTAADETKDAIKDHNEIRDAVAAVAGHAVGSGSWYAAVTKAKGCGSGLAADVVTTMIFRKAYCRDGSMSALARYQTEECDQSVVIVRHSPHDRVFVLLRWPVARVIAQQIVALR